MAKRQLKERFNGKAGRGDESRRGVTVVATGPCREIAPASTWQLIEGRGEVISATLAACEAILETSVLQRRWKEADEALDEAAERMVDTDEYDQAAQAAITEEKALEATLRRLLRDVLLPDLQRVEYIDKHGLAEEGELAGARGVVELLKKQLAEAQNRVQAARTWRASTKQAHDDAEKARDQARRVADELRQAIAEAERKSGEAQALLARLKAEYAGANAAR